MTSDFEGFAAIVATDAALQAELWPITDTTSFVARVVECAQQRGFTVLADDVWRAYHEGRDAWLAIWNP